MFYVVFILVLAVFWCTLIWTGVRMYNKYVFINGRTGANSCSLGICICFVNIHSTNSISFLYTKSFLDWIARCYGFDYFMQCVAGGIKLILVPSNKGFSNHALVSMLRFRDSARFLNYPYKCVS
jgi:hypothetical protein